MLCDVCKDKEATVYLTQILEGKMQKVNLCESCSKEKGVTDPTGFALADLLLGLGAAQEMDKGSDSQRCPVCGFTQVDFKKTGRLGCSACYDTFSDGLAALLKTMHKGTLHAGKSPERFREQRRLDVEIQTLRESLADAISMEMYEKAADLRDQLRKLESEAQA